MSLFNDKLKEIRIRELVILVIVSMIIIFALDLDESWVYVIVIAYVLFRCRKGISGLSGDISNLYSKISFKTCTLILVTNIILAIALGIVMNYLLTYYPFLDYMPSYEMEEAAGLTLAYLVMAVDVAIIAPISEEFIFRGILLNRLDKKLPMIVAILLSSLLFGFLHGASGFISAFIFGVCMCIVYLKTQNILVSISIHFLNNLLALILEIVLVDESIFESDVIIGVMMILGVVSLYYIMKFITKGYKEIAS